MEDYKWYVLRVRSGFEHNVCRKIRDELTKENLLTDVEEMLVPVLKSVVGDVEANTIKEVVPIKGSIFMKMKMSDMIDHIITSLNLVAGFYKSGSKYAILSQEFIDNLDKKIKLEEERLLDEKNNFKVGETIEIVNHEVYSTFRNGKIAQIKGDIYYVTVLVLGQETTIKLEKHHLQKV